MEGLLAILIIPIIVNAIISAVVAAIIIKTKGGDDNEVTNIRHLRVFPLE